MKVCGSCKEKKPLAEFNQRRASSDGRQTWCRKCSEQVCRDYRDNNRDKVREYDRNRAGLPARKAARNAIRKKWESKNAPKIKARRILNAAIKSGKLIRQPCCVCHNTKSHAHHEDYSKPLDVIWLCSLHHAKLHTDRNRMARGLAPAPGEAVVVKSGSTAAASLEAL
jgi:hypothetical protein